MVNKTKNLDLYSQLRFWRRSSTFFGELFFKKKSSAKETSTKNEMKVNSISFLDYKVLIFDVMLLTVLSIATITPIYNRPAEVEAASSADSMSLTLNTTKANASVDLVVKDSNGTFVSSNSENSNAVFTAATTNYTGYTLNLTGSYAASNTDRAKLYTSNGVSLTSITATSGVSAENFASSANTGYNGQWGFGYYKGTSGTISTYYPAPSTTATTIGTTTGANSGTSTDTYNIALGARADYSKAAGEYSNSAYSTYSNTYKLAITANAYSYKITFNKGNTTDSVSNLPGDSTNHQITSDSMTAASITLPTTVPTRTGYTFDGWCSVNPTVSGVNANTCSGDSYAAGATFYFDRTANNNNITLYAKWKITTYTVNITRNNVTNVTFTTGSTDTTNCATQSSKTATATLCHGVSYTITMSPSTNFQFSSWSTATNGTLGSTSSASTTYTVTGNTTLTATAARITRQVAVATSNAASVTFTNSDTNTNTACPTRSNIASGSKATLCQGVAYTLSMTPNTGYSSGSFSLNNSNYGTLSGTTFTPNANSGSATITATATANSYDCTKRYRLQNADGTWGSYTTETTEKVAYNSTCSYSKTVTDYKASASGTNNGQASTSATMNSTSGITVSLDFYRNTYTLTVNRNTSYLSAASASTAAVHGTNYYRWGQSVSISATASSGNKFSAWSQTSPSSPTGTFGSTTSASTTFTMPKANTTIYANGATDKLYLQNITYSQCTTTAQTVYDKRDGQAYTIQRLSDNRCWMLDNLKLGGVTLTEALSTSNTNMSNNGFTLPSSGSISAYNTKQINTSYYNTSVSYGNGNTTYGVYYNYCAASAGTYCMAGGSGSGNASYDVCPYGWRMPTGGSSGEYQTLYSKYNNWTSFRNAFHAPLSGYFYDSSASNQGTYGYFWSSTYYDGNSMYRLFLDGNSSTVNPASGGSRYNGRSVRCILKATS